MKRNATAIWFGSGKDGHGKLSTESTALNNTQFSFRSRFADGVGTNPEELLAAAHAGCFTMKLSFVLGEAGFVPESLKTTSYVSLDGGIITESRLVLEAKIPGIDESVFNRSVKEAEENCPVSLVLKAKVTVEALLHN